MLHFLRKHLRQHRPAHSHQSCRCLCVRIKAQMKVMSFLFPLWDVLVELKVLPPASTHTETHTHRPFIGDTNRNAGRKHSRIGYKRQKIRVRLPRAAGSRRRSSEQQHRSTLLSITQKSEEEETGLTSSCCCCCWCHALSSYATGPETVTVWLHFICVTSKYICENLCNCR